MNSNSSTDCPICGGKFDPLTVDRRLYQQCRSCGFLQKDASLFLSADEEKTRYEKHSIEPEEGYVRMLECFISDAVLPFATGSAALDFGAGQTGVLADHLRKKGFSVSEYDPHFHADETLLQKNYDLVTAVEVVEHFQNPSSSWILLAKLVRTGGILAVRTLFQPETLSGWWYLRDTTHYGFYRDSVWEAVADRYGFRSVYTNHRNMIVLQKMGT